MTWAALRHRLGPTYRSDIERPPTKYVSVGEADVAYQVIGDGPMDLLFCYGLGSHIELVWDAEPLVEIFRRLASFSRLIYFDRRGTGASDRVPDTVVPTWEQWGRGFPRGFGRGRFRQDRNSRPRRCRTVGPAVRRDASRARERPDPVQHGGSMDARRGLSDWLHTGRT